MGFFIQTKNNVATLKKPEIILPQKENYLSVVGGHGIEARLLGAKLAIKAESPDLASTFL